MSKLTEELRAKAIFNSHDFAYAAGSLNSNYSGERPAPPRIEGLPWPTPMLYYRSAAPGRGYTPAQWMASQQGVDLDPKAHWQDRGRKVWGMYGSGSLKERREAARLEAIAWMTERFGVEDWAKDPWGVFMPAAFVKARLAQLKAYTPEG